MPDATAPLPLMGRQRLGFQSLTEEVGPVELPVSGHWPAWLDGALIRTGPALFEVGSSRYRHWFDGLAMLYRFGFQAGRVHYTNRVLRSRGYQAAQAQGRIVYDEFDTTADSGLWRRLAALLRGPSLSDRSDNANVNVIARTDGVFALTETPTPMAIDPWTLETLGPRPFPDGLRGQLTTAHPHTDLNRRVQVNYLLEFGRHSIIHLFEHPLEGEPCFAFHQANAFDDGDAVVIDLCAYPNADIVTGLRLEPLRGPGTAALALSRLRRYRLPKAGGEATCEEISEAAVELPRINEPRAAGRRYRSLWAAASRGPDSGFLDQVVRLDLEHGSRAAVWEQADGFTGEPLFVPRPGSRDETEGIVLCQVLDTAARQSLLLGLEAKSLEEVARATLPHVVPFNFHGHYLRPGEFHDTVG